MVVYADWLLRAIEWLRRARKGRLKGITLFPFIFIRKKDKGNKVFIQHERIHIMQQMETLVVFFYILYLGEYAVLRLYYKLNHYDAYKWLSFEREAYRFEAEEGYLKRRRWFQWIYNN